VTAGLSDIVAATEVIPEEEATNIAADSTSENTLSDTQTMQTPDPPMDAPTRPTETASHNHLSRTPDLHFYLVKPLTSSTTRVLIPLQPTSTLQTCLRGQVVLEFPTIQVLKHPPNDLPEGFQLERAYIEETRRTIQELDEELGDISVYDQGVGKSVLSGREEEAFQDSKVLESLRRDVDVVRDYAS